VTADHKTSLDERGSRYIRTLDTTSASMVRSATSVYTTGGAHGVNGLSAMLGKNEGWGPRGAIRADLPAVSMRRKIRIHESDPDTLLARMVRIKRITMFQTIR
jgi:hypothetical protein